MRTWIACLLLAVSTSPLFAQFNPVASANLARREMTLRKSWASSARASMADYRDNRAPLARSQAVTLAGAFGANAISLGNAEYALGGPAEPAADALLVQAQQLEMQADTSWSSGNYIQAGQQYVAAMAEYEKTQRAYAAANGHYQCAWWYFVRALSGG